MPAELFTPLKVIHVLSVIIAVGANATYAFWLSAAERDPVRLAFAIEGIRRLDRRLANPAYGLVLITGILMVLTGQYSFDLNWIRLGFGLYVVIAIVGIVFFAPAIRRQLELARAEPIGDEYETTARRTRALGWATLAVVFFIVWLMVAKPF